MLSTYPSYLLLQSPSFCSNLLHLHEYTDLHLVATMALAIGAHIPSLDSLFHPEVSARSFSVLQTRQNSTSGRNNSTASNNENTVNLFIDGYSEDFEYGASIINVCAGTTTMALQCLSPATVRVPLLATSITCGTNAEVSPP